MNDIDFENAIEHRCERVNHERQQDQTVQKTTKQQNMFNKTDENVIGCSQAKSLVTDTPFKLNAQQQRTTKFI